MNWWQWTLFAFSVVLSLYAIIIPRLGGWLRTRREEDSVPQPTFSLDDPRMREQLRNLLEHYNVVGDCDIRDGKVYAARRTGETNAMAYALMSLYRSVVDKTSNPNLALYTVQHGELIPLGGLDLNTLREIAQLLEDASGR